MGDGADVFVPLMKERAKVVLPAPTSPRSKITSPACAAAAIRLCVEDLGFGVWGLVLRV